MNSTHPQYLQKEDEALSLQTHKMETIGILAAGIAHDLNNILTPILGYTDMMLKAGVENDPKLSHVHKIRMAAYRAKQLVGRILAFSRPNGEDKKLIHLSDCIEEAMVFLRAILPPTINLEFQSTASNDLILANGNEIQQIIINLCINAAQATIPQGSRVEVKLCDHIAPVPGQLQTGSVSRDCKILRMSVSDNGCGIAPSMIPRIFDPFFTSKPDGTGLGLSTVRDIVSKYNGAISVETALEKGASFHIFLPSPCGKLKAPALKAKTSEPGWAGPFS